MRLNQLLNDDVDTNSKEYQQALDKSVEKAVGLVIKNCKPFLNEINNNVKKYKLYRGYDIKEQDVEKFERGLMIKKKVRKNRNPKDVPDNITKMMNDLFKEHFNYPYRTSALFTIGDQSHASHYGLPFLIFPIGDFTYLWSKVDGDMFEGDLYFMIEELLERLPNYLDELKSEIQEAEMEYKSISEEYNNLLQQDNPDPEEVYDYEQTIKSHQEYIADLHDELKKAQKRFKTDKKEIDQHVKKYLTQRNLRTAINVGHEIMVATDYYYMIQATHSGIDIESLFIDKLANRLKK